MASPSLPTLSDIPPRQREPAPHLPEYVSPSGVRVGDYLYLPTDVCEVVATDDSVPGKCTITGRKLFPGAGDPSSDSEIITETYDVTGTNDLLRAFSVKRMNCNIVSFRLPRSDYGSVIIFLDIC